MKNRIFKIFTAIFCILALLSSFSFLTSASPTHEITVKIKNEDSGTFRISLYIPEPDSLATIDLSLTTLSESVEIVSINTLNTDSEKYSSDIETIPDIIQQGDTHFTFSSETTSQKAIYVGYFIDSFTSDKDFYICDIIIAVKSEITLKDNVTLEYTLTCENCTKTASDTYSLLSGERTDTPLQTSYPLGDADLNGQVSASDARTILRVSVGLDSVNLDSMPYINCDYDDKISAADARYALRASVKLEKKTEHSFDITLRETDTCENGGLYAFICELTGISFSMEIKNGGHICYETDCFSTGKCIVCNQVIRPATGHNYDDNGFCIVCNASKAELESTIENLIPFFEEISHNDTLADENLAKDNYEKYIEYSMAATMSIKNAVSACEGINGLQEVHLNLQKAYKIRFDAFISCTNNEGFILTNARNCNTIAKAVKTSNVYIDYASYIKD